MLRFFLLAFAAFISQAANAQLGFSGAYNVDSSPQYQNSGLELLETSTHEFICLSFSKGHVSFPYIMGLAKMDSFGNINWKKYINIPCGGTQVYPIGVVELSDKNYLFYGTGEIDCLPLSNYVGYFVKTDTSGN